MDTASILCSYCGHSIQYGHNTPRRDAIEEMSQHEQECDSNPLVHKLELLQTRLDAAPPSEVMLGGVDDCGIIRNVRVDMSGRVLVSNKPRMLLRRPLGRGLFV